MEPVQDYALDFAYAGINTKDATVTLADRPEPLLRALRSPLAYLEARASHEAGAPAPRAFPSATILAALRAAREEFHVHTPTRDDRDAVKTDDGYKAYLATHPNRAVRPNDCVGNLAPHWSDLQLHYFCQFPQLARACYTIASGVFAAGLDTTVPAARYRARAIEVCTWEEDAFRSAYAAHPAALAAHGEARKYAAAFQAFHATQWVTEERSARRVNLFDYVMLSSTYAFDFARQQAVLNHYYGDLKPLEGGRRTFDPKDVDDCNAYRWQRGIEYRAFETPKDDPWPPPPRPADRNHCLATKTYGYPLASAGR